MQGQRCPLCAEMTAEFSKRLGCWACRCGWTDRRPGAAPVPRRLVFEDGEEDHAWSGLHEDDGLLQRVEGPLRIRHAGS